MKAKVLNEEPCSAVDAEARHGLWGERGIRLTSSANTLMLALDAGEVTRADRDCATLVTWLVGRACARTRREAWLTQYG